MSKRISKKNQRRFVELLDTYLTKSGRKKVELARACHWDASMVTKIMKLDARPSLAVFHQFMAPFLVAQGGITHARQVIEMAKLLGGELDEADLLAVADAAERHEDPYQSQFHFRERADKFRRTIQAAWTQPEPATSDTEPGSHPIPQAVTVEAGTEEISTLQETASIEIEDEPVPAPTAQAEPIQDRTPAPAEALAGWRSLLNTVVPPPDEELDLDEVIAILLEWESQLADREIARPVWDWLGDEIRSEKLRQKSRLEFVLRRYDGTTTWNRLEWEWLDWLVSETARRHAGQAQLSPRQLASFVADLGQIALEAVKQSDGKGPSLAVNLNAVRSNLPLAQGATWDWLRRIAQVGPIRLSLQGSDVCQFISREEAEFLAAQYLLQEASDDDVRRIVQNSGRPFGVLRQMVWVLHFTGRDESVSAIVQGLLSISEVIPLRYLDAAKLLVVCEGRNSKLLTPLWAQVEETLCQSWADANADAPEYRAAIAKVMCELQSERFKTALWQALMAGPVWGRTWEAALRGLATLGGAEVLKSLQAIAESAPPDNAPEQQPLLAVLAAAHCLPPTDEAALLTALALREGEYDEQWRAALALAETGTIPTLRALRHIADEAGHPHLRRYAETRLDLLYNPTQAAVLARELDAASPADDASTFHGLLQQAKAMLHRSVWVKQDESGQARAGNPSRTLSHALARVWANPDIEESFRVEVGLSLMSAHAWPAFAICLGMLPLVDVPDQNWAGLTERLLVSLTPKTAALWLWQLLDKAPTSAQRAALIRCLGCAGGLTLDERFEHLLTQSDETTSIAAVGALADSLGQAAGARLWQVAEVDGRPGVRTAAYEGLAVIGSEKALPYLQEKLSSPDGHVDACFQLARLRHPDAERQLTQAARAATDVLQRDTLYLTALAISGGAIAVQAIYDLVGPQPNELTLLHLRDQFADDTATRAEDVWMTLVNDASPDWRTMAAEVLVRDNAQTLIEPVVRLALEDQDRRVREFARECLWWHAPLIASEPTTEYVLGRLEQQVRDFAPVDKYLLELLQKCLSGGQTRPAEIVHRTLALLWPMLSQARPTDEAIVPLLATFAYPEFVEAAGDVTRLLEQAAEASVQRRALETLIAMRALGLFEILVHLARSSRWAEIREYASHFLAEAANFGSLMSLPSELKPDLYRATLLRDVRIQRDLMRRKVIVANGQGEWV